MKTPAIRELLFTELISSERIDLKACHLWLWTTNNFLVDGLEVMRFLGFRYINNVAWVKARQERETRAPTLYGEGWLLQRIGLGQYFGGQHELLLFGVRGTLPAFWHYADCRMSRPGTVLLAPRGEHSEKPVEQYDIIRRVSPGPRLEMFARKRVEGWDAWGNEVPDEA